MLLPLWMYPQDFLLLFFIAATQPSTDWHLKENAREHHTSKFSSEELVVRRGQAFTITFNGTERPEQNLIFIAETGMAPGSFTETVMLPQDILLAQYHYRAARASSQCARSHSHGAGRAVGCVTPTSASSHSFFQLPMMAQIHLRGGLASLHQHWEKCYLFFLKGPKPSKAAKTLATFDVSSTASKEGWSAVLQSSSSSSVSISISSPQNAVIGRYRLSVQTGTSTPASLGTFVLLFNPWSSGMIISNCL